MSRLVPAAAPHQSYARSGDRRVAPRLAFHQNASTSARSHFPTKLKCRMRSSLMTSSHVPWVPRNVPGTSQRRAPATPSGSGTPFPAAMISRTTSGDLRNGLASSPLNGPLVTISAACPATASVILKLPTVALAAEPPPFRVTMVTTNIAHCPRLPSEQATPLSKAPPTGDK